VKIKFDKICVMFWRNFWS